MYIQLDTSGNLVQKECTGTESKSETEKLLIQAMEDYESKRFIAKPSNITFGQLLDTWAEEELKTGTLSNNIVGIYIQAINRIKQHPVSRRKLKTVTSGHLQQFMDIMSFGDTIEDFVSKRYSIDYVRAFSAVLQQSFCFAVFPEQYITFNPMQYGEFYHRNFCREVTEKNQVHYEYYNLGMTENVPEDYTKTSFVCPRKDGCLELPATVETA